VISEDPIASTCRRLVTLFALATLVGVGCGGGSSESSSAAGPGTGSSEPAAAPAPVPTALISKLQSCRVLSPAEVEQAVAQNASVSGELSVGDVTFEPALPQNLSAGTVARNVCRYTVTIDGVSTDALMLDWGTDPGYLAIFASPGEGDTTVSAPAGAASSFSGDLRKVVNYPGLSVEIGQSTGYLFDTPSLHAANQQLFDDVEPRIAACYSGGAC
jgi:hypothetical protein